MSRKRRLTLKKRQRRNTGVDPDLPTEKEWATMPKYGSFIVDHDGDDGEDQHQFAVGDVALVLPNSHKPGDELELYEYWVAKIKEIRQRSSNDEVFARVQWYWSGEEVSCLIKSFDASHCGRYERLLSDQYDFVSSSCFSGHITVHKYNERSIDQVEIDEEEFFCRYTLEHRLRNVDPKPVGTCVCKQPYNPDNPSGMRFCPRPSCRRAYHQTCLLKAKFKETDTIGSELRLLASSPDSDLTISLDDLVASKAPTKRGRKKQPVTSLAEVLASLPAELVQIAQQPIVKGGSGGRLVGNVRSVVAARRLVYGALEGMVLPEDWASQVDMSLARARRGSRKAVPALSCPECSGPI